MDEKTKEIVERLNTIASAFNDNAEAWVLHPKVEWEIIKRALSKQGEGS